MTKFDYALLWKSETMTRTENWGKLFNELLAQEPGTPDHVDVRALATLVDDLYRRVEELESTCVKKATNQKLAETLVDKWLEYSSGAIITEEFDEYIGSLQVMTSLMTWLKEDEPEAALTE